MRKGIVVLLHKLQGCQHMQMLHFQFLFFQRRQPPAQYWFKRHREQLKICREVLQREKVAEIICRARNNEYPLHPSIFIRIRVLILYGLGFYAPEKNRIIHVKLCSTQLKEPDAVSCTAHSSHAPGARHILCTQVSDSCAFRMTCHCTLSPILIR